MPENIAKDQNWHSTFEAACKSFHKQYSVPAHNVQDTKSRA
jgi:hypothetical protein